MLYDAYDAGEDWLTPLRLGGRFWRAMLGEANPFPGPQLLSALGELAATTRITHTRPDFGIAETRLHNAMVPVEEAAIWQNPFVTLLNFRKTEAAAQPRVLVVAPMSGHFPTLLRGTVETMLPDCDTYITDWHNARDVPVEAGRFGFEDCVDAIIDCLRAMGPGAHVLAVCQPAVPVLVAAAVMAAARDPAQPRSITLMAGPIDTRQHPTAVNDLAQSRPIEAFERDFIQRVPWRHKGHGRLVYPGFIQLTAFMMMNAGRHAAAHQAQLRRLFAGDAAGAEAHRRFYDEYFAVSDLAAEFYLETVEWVFQRHLLARGEMTHRGAPVDCGAIRRTALLVVEGERDDVCGIGQTMAALDLCRNVPTARKHYHLQTGVGHYGVFNGHAWAQQIYPKVRQLIEEAG